MLRVHQGTTALKYDTGTWEFDNVKEEFKFNAYMSQEHFKEKYITCHCVQFRKTITHDEELIFRQEYERANNSIDGDSILIGDIINLVLFLMPKEFITRDFIEFMFTREVDSFLNALIIYFEHFLKLVEFIQIRRDDIQGDDAQMQSGQSYRIKQILSEQLVQHRLILARNYSIILKGEGDMAKYYHMSKQISKTNWDRRFHEHFFTVNVIIVWIAMYRRAFDYIEDEMLRLFGSDHFKFRGSSKNITFSYQEASLLYGPHYKRFNYQFQISPLAFELKNASFENQPLLWIGIRMYPGYNLRIKALELEYIVPESQLHMINVQHGILGHPKQFYNTLLQLSWPTVREANYSLENDPHKFLTQPYIEMPDINIKEYPSGIINDVNFRLQYLREPLTESKLNKWLQREAIVHYYSHLAVLKDVVKRAEIELSSVHHDDNVEEILARFKRQKLKTRKHMSILEGVSKYGAISRHDAACLSKQDTATLSKQTSKFMIQLNKL